MARPDPLQRSLLFDPAPARSAIRQSCRLAGQVCEYTLNRSARRRSITLTIAESGLRVGAPMRAPQHRIDTVLNEHADWIVRKLAEWAARRPPPFNWIAGDCLMLLGNALTLRFDATADAIGRENGVLKVPAALAAPAVAATAVHQWLRATAQTWFTQRVAHFAPELRVKIPSLRLSNARTRWGTCHPHGRIHLNWRLIHMPPALIDYVVVHELAHLHEPNHSPRFWRRVAAVLPDHLQRRQLLRCEAHRYLLP